MGWVGEGGSRQPCVMYTHWNPPQSYFPIVAFIFSSIQSDVHFHICTDFSFWFFDFFFNIFFLGGRTPFPSMINMPPDTSPYHNIPIACYLAWKLFILAQPAMETVLGKHCARYYRFQLPTDDREYKHGEKVTRNKISYLLSYFARRHLRIYLSLYQASNIERVSTLNNK